MRVVIDTNVVVSSLIKRTGNPIQLMELAQAKRFDVIVSDEVLGEYISVLQRPNMLPLHGLESSSVAQVVWDLFSLAFHVSPTESLRVVNEDPKDDKFIECAVDGGADFLVSGDRHLLTLGSFQGIPIVTRAMFIAFLEQEEVEHSGTIE